jgi:hypothetical protein
MKSKCFLKKQSKCVLGRKNPCCMCSYSIKKIEGIDDMKDYVNIVMSRNNTKRAYIVSALSLLVSALMLVLKILETCCLSLK